MAMVWIQGVGMRYVIIEIGSETDPDYGVDEGEPGHPEHPDQGLPPGQRPPVAGQPLPPQRPGQPPQPGQPLPPQRPQPPAGGIGGRPPARPGPQPPVAQPKR
jgi:hypothetical protein